MAIPPIVFLGEVSSSSECLQADDDDEPDIILQLHAP